MTKRCLYIREGPRVDFVQIRYFFTIRLQEAYSPVRVRVLYHISGSAVRGPQKPTAYCISFVGYRPQRRYRNITRGWLSLFGRRHDYAPHTQNDVTFTHREFSFHDTRVALLCRGMASAPYPGRCRAESRLARVPVRLVAGGGVGRAGLVREC